jgi:hypothetical protein
VSLDLSASSLTGFLSYDSAAKALIVSLILPDALAAQGRWYPLSTGVDKLFVGALVGFNLFSLDGETDSDKGGMTGLVAGLKAGWKILFGPAFFMEPAMSYVYAKIPAAVSLPGITGWQAGLTVGGAF